MATMLLREHIAKNVIKRAYCEKCKEYAFVIDGKYSCCSKMFIDKFKNKKYMCQPRYKRRYPSKKYRDYLKEKQNNCCLYCGREIGYFYMRENKLYKSKINWDHKTPYIYSANNKKENFALVCNVCNSLKGSMMFETFQDTIEYLKKKITKKIEKGYFEYV